MPRNKDVEPYEPELAWRRAHDAVEQIPRDDAVHLACTLCDSGTCGWVRKAHLARQGALVVRCFGRFDLHNPERPDLPWPAIVFGVRQKSGPSQALLMLYYGINPKSPDQLCWLVNDEGPTDLPDGGRGIYVDVRRYTGDPKGPPGVVNGDGPVSPARPQPIQSAAIAEAAAVAPPAPRSTVPATRSSARTRKPKPSARSSGSRVSPPAAVASPAPLPQSPKQELVLRLLRLLQD